MLKRIASKIREITRDCSGNATLMVALGIPALIGGSGMAVDLAQWYLWKRELQYAVDQAAVAGAFARSETATQDQYSTRAAQEYNANLSVISQFASTPAVALDDYDGGQDNLVVVSAQATKKLPFSSFLTGNATTVRAQAKATFVAQGAWTSCLIALDTSAPKAVWFNGGPDVNASCGVAAISNASNAIEVSGGSGTLDLGWVIAAGGIDDYFDALGNTIVVEHANNLIDPFANAVAPDNPAPQTLSCNAGQVSYSATYDVDVDTYAYYYEGSKRNELQLVSTTLTDDNSYTESGSADSSTAVGQQTSSTHTDDGDVDSSGSGNSKLYFRTDIVTETTRTVTSVSSAGGGSNQAQPGTYTNFNPGCDIAMAPGIFVIDGGAIEINAQYSVTGSSIMFVLKNGARVKINGGASINLTAMDTAELLAEGLAADQAALLDGMLIIEDRSSPGVSDNRINGNADTYLNGTIYLPNSHIDILGTASVNSRCLMIASKTMKIGGTADLSTFCPPGMSNDVDVTDGTNGVRLVA